MSLVFRRYLKTCYVRCQESFWDSPVLKGAIKINKHRKTPVRTRFAPSPTGYLHLGSIRTALFNYLLARNTGGQFLLRIEDTDQKRLITDAEENIYNTLNWLGLKYDEGPQRNDNIQSISYKQSERSEIYDLYIKKLLETGNAYHCFCPKERLLKLRESAQKLKPPTNVAYDRKCYNLSDIEIEENIKKGIPYTIRLKSPMKYPEFEDLLHGSLNIQPQKNPLDIRYDDPVLMKSNDLPTYHFANVIDDHLMEITHVIRGEEWLPSTPKHLAIYEAFGWKPPKFVHIPLLTSLKDKKLSKRKGDMNISQLKDKGILPEALVNFCALLGWSPPRELSSKNHECFTLSELEKLFNLNNLTKGNVKVDERKLLFFNKHYLSKRIDDDNQLKELANSILPTLQSKIDDKITQDKVEKVLRMSKGSLDTVKDLTEQLSYCFVKPQYKQIPEEVSTVDPTLIKQILEYFCSNIDQTTDLNLLVNQFSKLTGNNKKYIYQVIRFALSGKLSGLKLNLILEVLGVEEVKSRFLAFSKEYY